MYLPKVNPAPKLLYQIIPSTLDIRHNMLQFYSFNSNQEHASIRTSQFQPLLPINCQIQENNLPTAPISFSNRRWTCSRHLIINVEPAKDQSVPTIVARKLPNSGEHPSNSFHIVFQQKMDLFQTLDNKRWTSQGLVSSNLCCP